jgi:HAE1 family hydrophobic/amphiphilic exporter-1
VQGLKDINSTSSDNLSVITLEFDWGKDLNEAVNDVRDAIDLLYNNLPDGCDRPSIFKISTSMMPILMYTVTANESYMGLQKMLDDQIANPLKRIDGIGSISVIGAPERYIYVEVDPKKLDATGITLEQVSAAIASNNLNLPAGSIKMGQDVYQLRVEGEFKESSEINDLVVGSYNGASIYMKDIATVRDTIKDVDLYERSNGAAAVRLTVTRQSGANTVNVAKQVKKELASLEKTLPSDVKFNLVYDSSDFIGKAIGNLSETLLLALIFVVFVVLLFLGRFRATLIIAATIPISLLTAAIYLFATGSTLNVISLSSLSIAIGMVVDDAIVVLENISKHIRRGSSAREASIYATNEVWLAVIVSTLVVIAVFLPLTMVGGMMGIMFKELGWIVTITITTSVLTAITLTPMLSAKMLDEDYGKGHPWFDKTMGVALDELDSWYEKAIRWALHHKVTVISVTASLFIGSLFLIPLIGTDFMPEADQGRLTVSVELQTGTRVEESLKTTERMEAYIFQHCPEVITLSSSTGSIDNASGGLAAILGDNGSNIINLNIRLADLKDRKRSDKQIAEQLRTYLKTLPEVINYTVSTGGLGSGLGSNNIEAEIYGYDFNKTNAIAQQIKDQCQLIPGDRDIKISRKNDKADLQVILDKEKLALHGLSSATVSNYIRNRINGATVGYSGKRR